MIESSHRIYRAIVACLALSAIGFPAFSDALRVHIAPFAILDDASTASSSSLQPEKDLLESISSIPMLASIDFSAARSDTVPSTFLEAARLCELLEYPLLLYGYVKISDGRYFSEIKLLDREGKKIVTSFISTDSSDHYDRLIKDLASKIVDYFLVDLGIEPVERRDTSRRNLFELPFSLGYWTPVGDWASVEMGIIRLGAGCRYIPKDPLFAIYSKPFHAGVGLRVEYSLGKNLPELETSFLHSIGIRLPVEAFLDLTDKDRIGIGLSAIISFDILAQQRKYAETYTQTTSTGGASFSLLYRRKLSDLIDIGVECRFDALFYSDPLYRLVPSITLDYALGGAGNEASGGGPDE